MGTPWHQGGFVSPFLTFYPSFFNFLQCFSPSISLPASLHSFASWAAPIPVSLDVLTEPSLCPLAHVPHPSFHEWFLFCLYPEVMHRPGVGVGLHVALPSSLPTVQEGEGVLGGGEGKALISISWRSLDY